MEAILGQVLVNQDPYRDCPGETLSGYGQRNAKNGKAHSVPIDGELEKVIEWRREARYNVQLMTDTTHSLVVNVEATHRCHRLPATGAGSRALSADARLPVAAGGCRWRLYQPRIGAGGGRW